MEKFINTIISRLYTKVDSQTLYIVKEELTLILMNYDLVEKTTELSTDVLNVCAEMECYLAARTVEGYSEGTIKGYRNIISNFLYYLGKQVTTITSNDIRYYLYAKRKGSSVSDCTLNTIRSYLNAFFIWLVDNDYIEKNPCRNIKPIKYEKNVRHAVKEIDMEKIRTACRDLRERAIIETLYATGCRVSELTKIKLSDIDFDNKEVSLHGKGKKERVSYLNARAVVAIQRYLLARKGDSEYLICRERKPYTNICIRQIEKIVNRIGKEVGVEIYPHKVRHTTATDAIDRGMPIEQVQCFMGHERISTTLEYAEVKQNNVKHEHAKCIV